MSGSGGLPVLTLRQPPALQTVPQADNSGVERLLQNLQSDLRASQIKMLPLVANLESRLNRWEKLGMPAQRSAV